MTEQEIVGRFKRNRPASVDDLLERCKLTLKYLSCGAFRKVYKIDRLPLVVKLPTAPPAEDGESQTANLMHARKEYNAWRKIMRSPRFKALRPYMPEVLYFNRNTGTLLMREYKPVLPFRRRQRMNEINVKVKEVLNLAEVDLGGDKADNYGLDRNGTLKIIDLAFLNGN